MAARTLASRKDLRERVGALRMVKRNLVYFENWIDPGWMPVLAPRTDIVVTRHSYDAPHADTWREIAGAHGYQVQPRTELREPWFGSAEMIARCPDLLAMSSTGAGYDVIDVDACTAAGVIVVNQSGTNSDAVSEHAVALMLALANKIVMSDRDIRKVKDLKRFEYVGVELRNKTVGIIGIGEIGRRTAAICKAAFNCTILAFDPYLSAEQIAARGAQKVELDEVMRRSDFISVHCPRTSESFGMIGAAQFKLMKPSAFFVTTGRGGVHKEDDLFTVLKDRAIAGAGLDVFLDEPPPLDHPLLTLDNVIATPHIAGVSEDALRAMAVGAAQQWITIFDGGVPPRLINPQAWPKYVARFERVFGIKPRALAA